MANDPQTQDKTASPLTPPPSAKQAAPKAPKAPPPSAKQAAPKAPKAPPPSAKQAGLEQLLAEAGDDPDKLRALILQQAAQPAAPAEPAPSANRPATYKTVKKRYYAQEDFEGSVGAGGLSSIALKGPQPGREHGQEIKDEPLALELIAQGMPVEVVEEPIELKTTYRNPDCPITGRWKARPGSVLVESALKA